MAEGAGPDLGGPHASGGGAARDGGSDEETSETSPGKARRVGCTSAAGSLPRRPSAGASSQHTHKALCGYSSGHDGIVSDIFFQAEVFPLPIETWGWSPHPRFGSEPPPGPFSDAA